MRAPKITGKDVAIALSLANVCYLRLWAELFCAGSSKSAYFLNVGNVDFIAAPVNVLLLAAAFLMATGIARGFGRAGRAAIIAGFVAVLLVQVSGIGPELEPGALAVIRRWQDGEYPGALAPVAGFLLVAGLAARWPRKSLTLATNAVYAFVPFVAVTFGRAAWILATVNPGESLARRAPPIREVMGSAMGSAAASVEGPRVVLIVFDAMGRRQSIEGRPEGLVLPEYDRFRAESIDLTQVTQPGTKTKISVPVLLSGLAVTDSDPANENELLLTVGASKEPWSKAPSLLRDARALGGVALVAGWYHPYCRIFPELDGCSWYPARTVGANGQDTGFVQTLRDQQTALVPYVNLRIRHVDIFRRQREDALAAVKRGKRGFVFLHLMVPHMPWIWDPESQSLSVASFHIDGFYDNLQLMDRLLGELRREMESAGTWKDTAVLVTADHVMRHRIGRIPQPPDARVPYLLKMPGQEQGTVYDRPISASVTHDLVLELLNGRLRTPAETAAWLDERP